MAGSPRRRRRKPALSNARRRMSVGGRSRISGTRSTAALGKNRGCGWCRPPAHLADALHTVEYRRTSPTRQRGSAGCVPLVPPACCLGFSSCSNRPAVAAGPTAAAPATGFIPNACSCFWRCPAEPVVVFPCLSFPALLQADTRVCCRAAHSDTWRYRTAGFFLQGCSCFRHYLGNHAATLLCQETAP